MLSLFDSPHMLPKCSKADLYNHKLLRIWVWQGLTPTCTHNLCQIIFPWDLLILFTVTLGLIALKSIYWACNLKLSRILSGTGCFPLKSEYWSRHLEWHLSAHFFGIASLSCSGSVASTAAMTQVSQTEKVDFSLKLCLSCVGVILHQLESWLVWVAGPERSSWWEVWNQTLCWQHWSKNNRVR